MKSIMKLLLVLAALFASTFLIMKSLGWLTIAQVENWLVLAQTASPIYVGLIVIGLLFLDLFIAVPTLTVMILAGYFLGHGHGFIAVISGTFLAAITGYGLSRVYGYKFMRAVIKDNKKISEATTSFNNHGFMMILLARALPILPEVTACLAGMTKMPIRRFLTAWSLSTLPYVLIATYAGSISSMSNPKPALLTAVMLSAFFGGAWWLFFYVSNKQKVINSAP
jgi:uncharacterized membrane protein YdjX (TVP38/TMEM64 family)